MSLFVLTLSPSLLPSPPSMFLLPRSLPLLSFPPPIFLSFSTVLPPHGRTASFPSPGLLSLPPLPSIALVCMIVLWMLVDWTSDPINSGWLTLSGRRTTHPRHPHPLLQVQLADYRRCWLSMTSSWPRPLNNNSITLRGEEEGEEVCN